MTTNGAGTPLVVLDDDPTGTQAVTGVPVLLEWDADLLAEAAGARAVHLLTNSRSLSGAEARRVVRDAVSTAASALTAPSFVLRGDSTLRAHLLEEYLGICEGAFPGRTPPLLLVPALPAAGRVTVGGVHLLERDGARVPLHETEYALDSDFGYRDARLLQWAEDRSAGFFPRAAGREVPLPALRSDGAAAVARALEELAASDAPAVCAPDAETIDDLALVAQGLRAARSAGVEVVVRSAPAFVGVLAGNLARATVAPPPARGGLLVLCGSYVATTTRQLAELARTHPASLIEVDVDALASDHPDDEIDRAAREAGRRLRADRLAVVATPRERPEATRSLAAGARIATNLARVLQAVAPFPDVVLAKGGITSAVAARTGLGARRARVAGPLIDGVALWHVESADRGTIPYVVFPGNVGDDGALLRVVERILGG